MLLEYAAQVKCLTTVKVVNSAHVIASLPRDISVYVRDFTVRTALLLSQLRTEIANISARRQQRIQAARRAHNARTAAHLQAATQLIQQGQSVADQCTSQMLAKSHEEESLLEADESLSAILSVDATDANQATVKSVMSLNEQINLLKQQMEALANLQVNDSTENTVSTEAAANCKPSAPEYEIPIAPPLSSPIIPSFSVPVAPPMMADFEHSATSFAPSHSSSSSRSSLDSTADIPIAPPLETFDIPMAPPLAPPMTSTSTDESSSLPAPPPLSVLSDVNENTPRPARARMSEKGLSLTDELKAVSLRARGESLKARRGLDQANVYTRCIPGEENMSHTDLIKVAAKVKLRKTACPRSPGGTPMKTPNAGLPLNSASASQADILASALRSKFRNARKSVHWDKENWETS